MSGLIEAIKAATEADLSELDLRLDELGRELEALKTAKRVVELRLRGKKPKAAGTRGPKPMSPTAERIYDLLAEQGQLPSSVIASRLCISKSSASACLTKSDWFCKTPEGDFAIAMGK